MPWNRPNVLPPDKKIVAIVCRLEGKIVHTFGYYSKIFDSWYAHNHTKFSLAIPCEVIKWMDPFENEQLPKEEMISAPCTSKSI